MKLTKARIEALKYEGDGTSRDVRWDEALKGFGIRIYPSGKKSFVLSYRAGKRRKRLLTIGEFGPLTLDRARELATLHKGQVIEGKDPINERRAASGSRTVKDLAARYLKEHAKGKAVNSYKADERNLNNHVLPRIGNIAVAEIVADDIDALCAAIRDGRTARPRKEGQKGGAAVTGGPIAANRVLSLCSKMFNLAERWRWRPPNSNPCRHIDKEDEAGRERFLSEKELAALGDALAVAEAEGVNLYALAAIRLLIFTGARLREILALKWAWVDLDRAMLRLPDSKTGAKVIYLSAPALDILSKLPKASRNPYVIVGEKRDRHLVNLHKPWDGIRKKAKLKGLHIHDLRHSFASVGAAGGASLLVIGKLLGHARATTTERYAHLSADPLRQANEAIANRIAAAMKGETADVVNLKRKA